MSSIEIECPSRGFKAKVLRHELYCSRVSKRYYMIVVCDSDAKALHNTNLSEYRIIKHLSPTILDDSKIYFGGKAFEAKKFVTEVRQKYEFYGQIVGYSFIHYQFHLRITEAIYLHLTDNILKE